MQRWMKFAVAGAVILIGVLIWTQVRRSESVADVDLVVLFDEAEKRSAMPAAEAFAVVDEAIEGDTRRAIYAHPPSRIIWKLLIPRDAWLRTALGIRREAWEQEGDGVLFRVGVSDGRTYEELLSQHLNPVANPGDRRWVPVNIDLSAYSGEFVELIFNTNTSPPGQGDDGRHDWAVWAAQAVTAR